MDLVTLLSAITFSVKTVGAMVRCLGLPCSAGAKNVREANESANETWIKSLTASRACSLLVSEECEEPISVSQPGTGQYAVVFDPLTGLAEPPTQDMGAIFGIFRQLSARGRSRASETSSSRRGSWLPLATPSTGRQRCWCSRRATVSTALRSTRLSKSLC
eukprot:TRINITY_DN206_c0_g1_i3.p3 TRINITY_DN206_c0_g1~~TRINITY_DN206_c0_g1_i3.p3  ORF type:complete len:161 (+),score=37.38 TRINITY_DN206_c0_g1_i3:620-1102(+)